MMYIQDLAVEVTRRCNMSCSHCLRGDAENVDLDIGRLETFSKEIAGAYIGTLTLTGGEPSLVPVMIAEVLNSFKKNNIEVGSFYIATNGKDITEAFVVNCLRWYAYCADNEISAVDVSNDIYHQREGAYDTDLLDGLSFCGRRSTEEGADYELISEGRSADCGSVGADGSADDINAIGYRDGISLFKPMIYLNALGDIILGCDWSYESQKDRVFCAAGNLIEALKPFCKGKVV